MLDGLKPYPAYKESGVPSLGMVPEHWGVSRIRDVARLIVSNVDKKPVEGEIPVRLCNYVDVYKNERIRETLPFMRATASPEELERFQLRLDDVVITKDSESWTDIGVPALVEYMAPDLVCGYHLAILRPHGSVLLGRYLFRVQQSVGVAYQYHVAASGVTRYGLSHDSIRGVIIPVPPTGEQESISRFLDFTDRHIRRYIGTRQRLIKLLEEQKLAIIDHAVRRGLAPNAGLELSGVEWLGEIPKHWGVARLRDLASRITSGSRGWSNYAADSGPLFIRIGNLTRTSVDLDLEAVVRLALPKTVLGEAARTRVAPGDVLLSITAFIGSVAVVPSTLEEAYVSQHVACCRIAAGAANPRWIAYVLLSPVGQTHGVLSMYGGTKQGLSLDDVKNYLVLLPPRAEQDDLVRRIDALVASIDSGIAEVKREVQLIRELRTRLIADVVTGKLDIREAAAQLPEETIAPDETGYDEMDTPVEDDADNEPDADSAGSEA